MKSRIFLFLSLVFTQFYIKAQAANGDFEDVLNLLTELRDIRQSIAFIEESRGKEPLIVLRNTTIDKFLVDNEFTLTLKNGVVVSFLTDSEISVLETDYYILIDQLEFSAEEVFVDFYTFTTQKHLNEDLYYPYFALSINSLTREIRYSRRAWNAIRTRTKYW